MNQIEKELKGLQTNPDIIALQKLFIDVEYRQTLQMRDETLKTIKKLEKKQQENLLKRQAFTADDETRFFREGVQTQEAWKSYNEKKEILESSKKDYIIELAKEEKKLEEIHITLAKLSPLLPKSTD